MIKLGRFTKVTCVFAATLFVVLAFAGCAKKDGGNADAGIVTTAAIPEVTEIDAFLSSVQTLKGEYDANNISELHVHDAAMQATVVEGFISEQPDLYQDTEYKTKIKEIYTIVKGIDPTKAGLEGKTEFKDLLTIVERLNKKANQ